MSRGKSICLSASSRSIPPPGPIQSPRGELSPECASHGYTCHATSSAPEARRHRTRDDRSLVPRIVSNSGPQTARGATHEGIGASVLGLHEERVVVVA
jgi:hypothetical protein